MPPDQENALKLTSRSVRVSAPLVGAALVALLVSSGAIALPAPLLSTPVASTAPASSTTSNGLTAVFSTGSTWTGGYIGNYRINNSGPAVSQWALTFQLPVGASITNSWNGSLSQSGSAVRMVNASWNGKIAQGASVQFGFQVAYSGAFVPPSGCTINGLPCAGGPAPAPTTTTVPSTTTTTSSTTTTTTTPTTTTTTTTVPPTPAPAPGGSHFAPYVDATLTPTFDLMADSSSTGTKTFTLAFIVGQGGGCTASWGGFYTMSQGWMLNQVQALRAAGGDVIISFGGAINQELALTCSTVGALQAQYQAVINEYHATQLDFDIEGSALGDSTSISRRFAALALLQAANPGLRISFTLPVLPTGLTSAGVSFVRGAAAAGVKVTVVNVMAMDYGDGAAPAPAGQMGTYAIDAATATEGQLRSVYPALSTAQAWAMVGITPLIGVNDISDEVFQLADAQKVTAFANSVQLGRLSMWSGARDVQCSGGAQPFSQNNCSSILQAPFAFSDIFVAY